MQVKISAVIICFNEEDKIERCILSLKEVSDEIIVVDSFSTDKTKEICNELNVNFFTNKFKGHIEQKNYALSLTNNNYVISLDADEALDKLAISSILKIKESWTYDAYIINRLNNFCGKWIRHGSWYPDKKIRIWNKKIGQWGGINPHDQVILNKTVSPHHIKGNILHYTVDSLEQFIKQTKYFSSISTNAYYKKGKKSYIINLLINPCVKFVQSYIIKLGFLDAKEGFIIARYAAYGTFLKYKELRKLQKAK